MRVWFEGKEIELNAELLERLEKYADEIDAVVTIGVDKNKKICLDFYVYE